MKIRKVEILEIDLLPGKLYTLKYIDTWNMKITQYPKKIRSARSVIFVLMPGKPYMAYLLIVKG